MSQNSQLSNPFIANQLNEEELLALANLALEKLFEEPDMDSLPQEIVNIETLEQVYDEPTDAGEHNVAKSGFSTPFVDRSYTAYPMHIAARQGDTDEIKRLIAKRYNVNGEDHLSSRPLHLASLFGHVEAVKLLVQSGADVNDTSYRGETALHIALFKGQYDVAQVLIKTCKAKTHIQNQQGHNAFSILTTQIITQVNILKKTSSPTELQKLIGIIDTINALVDVGQKDYNCNLGDGVKLPFPVVLKMYANHVPDKSTNTKNVRSR